LRRMVRMTNMCIIVAWVSARVAETGGRTHAFHGAARPSPQGTGDGFVSMGVFTDGSKYGVPAGICYSLPCKCAGGEWTVVDGLPIDAFSRAAMDKTKAELEEELELAKSLL